MFMCLWNQPKGEFSKTEFAIPVKLLHSCSVGGTVSFCKKNFSVAKLCVLKQIVSNAMSNSIIYEEDKRNHNCGRVLPKGLENLNFCFEFLQDL